MKLDLASSVACSLFVFVVGRLVSLLTGQSLTRARASVRVGTPSRPHVMDVPSPEPAADCMNAAGIVPASGSLVPDESAPKRRRLSISSRDDRKEPIEESNAHQPPIAPERGAESFAPHLQPLVDSPIVAPRRDTEIEAEEGTPATSSSRSIESGPHDAPCAPTLATTKRPYPCRVCGTALSSASNRTRHERTKHQYGAAVVRGPTTLAAQHGSVPFAPSAHGSRHLAVGQGIALASSHAHADTHEVAMEVDEDVELAQYAATATLVLPRSTSQSEEEDKLSGTDSSSMDEATAPDSSRSSSGSGSGSDASSPDMSIFGQRLLFTDEQLQEGCLPFLQWLLLPALTQTEALVKGRRSRLNTLEQLYPIKNNLRFLFSTLQERQLATKVDLELFTHLHVCRAVYDALGDRNCGPNRCYALFLLIKKVLIWLSSTRSSQQRCFVLPTIFESYLFVEGTCADNCMRRKQESRNRALLGITATQQLLQERHGDRQLAEPFTVPDTWASPAPVSGTKRRFSPASPAQVSSASSSAAAAKPTAVANGEQQSNNEMTPDELKLVTQRCMAQLHEIVASSQHHEHQLDHAVISVRDRWFAALLITASLCLGLAPRSQVLRQLRIGSSFKRHADGLFWVQLLAEQSKNSKPVMFAFPAELTPLFVHYLDHVRPRLLSNQEHDFLFLKRNGTPRDDFGEATRLVTKQLGLRPTNPHAFRRATITCYYEAGATAGEMHSLAALMSHDSSTAMQSYFRPNYTKAAMDANAKMTSLLLHD